MNIPVVIPTKNQLGSKSYNLTMQVLQEGISKYVFAGSFAKGKTILEIGCEKGFWTNYLMSKGAVTVVGGDITKEDIQFARGNYQADGLSFILLDGQKLPFIANSFDLVVGFEVIEHMVKYDDFLQECQRVLKDDGVFICSTPNKETVSPNSDKLSYYQHVKEFYPDEFQSLLSKYFKDVIIYGLYPTSRIRVRIKKLIYAPKPKIFYILKPAMMRVINSLPKSMLPHYHTSNLSEIDIENINKNMGPKFQPFPIADNPSCSGMMAIGRQSKHTKRKEKL